MKPLNNLIKKYIKNNRYLIEEMTNCSFWEMLTAKDYSIILYVLTNHRVSIKHFCQNYNFNFLIITF